MDPHVLHGCAHHSGLWRDLFTGYMTYPLLTNESGKLGLGSGTRASALEFYLGSAGEEDEIEREREGERGEE